MTRYVRTIALNRMQAQQAERDRGRSLTEPRVSVPEPLVLFSLRGPEGVPDFDFDRYQLAFVRAERETEE